MRDFEDGLAEAVGWVVIEAGRAESTAGELLMLYRPVEVTAAVRDWHSSGSALTRALRKSAAERVNVELDALADRLEQATEGRNDVVHGEWIHVPGVASVTFRRALPKAAPAGGYVGRHWTLERLQRLAGEYRAIERGFSDLVSEFMGLSGPDVTTT